MTRVIVVTTFELCSNDGGEHLGIGAYQCYLFLRSSLATGGRDLSRLG
jgi:hypothetical protein